MPLLVELAAVTSFDLIMADGEHSSTSPVLVEELARAATFAGVDLLVRPPARDSHFLAQYLDAGGQGVIVRGYRA